MYCCKLRQIRGLYQIFPICLGLEKPLYCMYILNSLHGQLFEFIIVFSSLIHQKIQYFSFQRAKSPTFLSLRSM